MNRRMILYLICQILRIEAVTMIPAAVIAIVQKEYPSLIGFIFAMLAMGGVSLLSAAFRVRKKEIYARDGFLTVSLAWIAVSLFGALPFWISGEIPNFIDCIFETVSGFTTTVASVVQNSGVFACNYSHYEREKHPGTSVTGGKSRAFGRKARAKAASNRQNFIWHLYCPDHGADPDSAGRRDASVRQRHHFLCYCGHRRLCH